MNLINSTAFRPLLTTGSSSGRLAVYIISNQYPQNQVSECLIVRIVDSYASNGLSLIVMAHAILASLFARAQVTMKLFLRSNSSLTQPASRPARYSSVRRYITDPQQCGSSSRAVLPWNQTC